jgi:uncharacterized protein YecT (DUF1311 family)
MVEPFSPPGTCDQNGTTLEISNCALEQVIDVDSTVNSLQQRRFEETPAAQQAGVLAEYARWLSGRTTKCRAKANTGGTVDAITAAQCLLRSSQDRVETLNDVS